MKSFLLILTLMTSFNYSFSQSLYNFSGKVTDENGVPIMVGDVLLFQNDSIVKYTYINNGMFLLEEIPDGNYTLQIYSLGYQNYLKKIDVIQDSTLVINLKEDATELDEVQITTTKKLIENRNGNLVANVENTVLSKEFNTIDLISKLPSVQVSPDRESISVIGKGNPLIYLGGQQISVEEFSNLPIDAIQTIEILTNPSAKYEANGRSVILITRRRNRVKGTKLTLTETASFKNYYNNYLSAHLNKKQNDIELRLDVSYNQLKVWESNRLDYELTDQNTSSDYLVKAVTIRPQFIFGGGLYYQLNNDDYISVSTRYRIQKDPFYIKTDTFLRQGGTENNIYSYSDNLGARNFSSSNVNFSKTITERSNLFAGIQYTYFDKSIENSIRNTYDNPFGETFLDRFQDFTVDNFSARMDYDLSFQKDTKIELGANYTNTSSNALNKTENNITTYKYTENNTALYAQFSGTVKKVNYSLGIRAENTKVTSGYQENSDLEIDRNTTILFPKGNINFVVGEEKKLIFNYSKTILRPNYASAASTAAFINPVLEFRGNISLQPTLLDEVSATFQYKDKSLSAEYSYIKNPVHYSLTYDDTDEISVMFPSNFKEEYGFVLNLSLPFTYKFWSSSNVISLNYNTINDIRAISLVSSPYVYLYTNHQFKINNTSSFNLNGWVLTDRQEGIFDRELVYMINAAFSKKLFDTLDVTVSFNDILNTTTFRESYQLQNIQAKSVFFGRSHEFAISLKYDFGTIQSSYKNKDVDDNLKRIR